MHERLGVAIDVGTTTVAVWMVDLETGASLGSVSRLNAQAAYGADVTSRIQYCIENGHEELTSLIREQLDEMVREVCLPPLQSENIEQVVIAANTVMQHLTAGYAPVAMGASPFTPVSLFGENLSAWESLPCAKNASIYYAPAISAYVGGDITAGLLAVSFEDMDKPSMFIDIGTNGEIVLKHNGTYYCCAAAAGPAFEGAQITCGMAAVNGAIDHVWQTGRGNGEKAGTGVKGIADLHYSTIGNAAPLGICGSGLIDLLAVLIENGEVDKTGRLVGKDRFQLADTQDGIYITAEDVRKLQLAKAAIAAGVRVLLHYAGINGSDIAMLALAGGFGTYLNPQNAANIGLFPKTLLNVAKAYGDAAGEGAAMAAYSLDSRAQLGCIAQRCEYIELSSNAFFNDMFVEEMGF